MAILLIFLLDFYYSYTVVVRYSYTVELRRHQWCVWRENILPRLGQQLQQEVAQD